VQPARETPGLEKLREYWDKQEPIPWVKIHDIPDFVRFPHKQHINADSNRFKDEVGANCDADKDPRSLECRVKNFKAGGDERCVSCHGEVSQMAVVQKVDQNFGLMGWCMECHLQVKGAQERKSAMSTMQGWFNAKENDAKREAAAQLVNEKGFHNPNLLDCYTCHY
jgi:hypothetical protein